MLIHDLLRKMKDHNASDLYLKVGVTPSIRVHGSVRRLETVEPLSDEQMQKTAQSILNEHQWSLFCERPDLDLSYHLDDNLRYRINVFRQKGHIGMVIRLIHDSELSFQNLHLPQVIREFAEAPRGLVIVTGATGSGKSTTLAAMVQHINRNYFRHIMTVEDPIEYIHDDDKSIINQREVGYDTNCFRDALRHVVRQSPDVILIGEMRDQETMMTAISAAETGHLVLTTLHTIDVHHTLDRIINYFPDYQQEQVRQELSMSLLGIISMRLLPRKDGTGRVPAMEILRATPTIRKALAAGEHWRMKELMQKGGDLGMQTFNQSLVELYREGLVDYEDALAASSNPEEFKLNARGMYTGTESITQFQHL